MKWTRDKKEGRFDEDLVRMARLISAISYDPYTIVCNSKMEENKRSYGTYDPVTR